MAVDHKAFLMLGYKAKKMIHQMQIKPYSLLQLVPMIQGWICNNV